MERIDEIGGLGSSDTEYEEERTKKERKERGKERYAGIMATRISDCFSHAEGEKDI